MASLNAAVYEPGLRARTSVVHVLDRVVLGRRVAAALVGEHVDHDRSVDLGGVGAAPARADAMSWPSKGPR